jgi:hypothetical protein
MSLNYKDMNDDVRLLMIDEINIDCAENKLYLSSRLNQEGKKKWADLLKEAAKSNADEWLATELIKQRLLNTEEERRKPTGGTTIAKVPVNANETLAEGEFNRFYCRAVCKYAIANKNPLVQVYRARQSKNPRSESILMEGKTISPVVLLNDLRTSQGVDTALRMPPGPNSGLSVCIKK